jgi:hypothetical protein
MSRGLTLNFAEAQDQQCRPDQQQVDADVRLADRDPIAGTPWLKHNPARIERISAAEEVAA